MDLLTNLEYCAARLWNPGLGDASASGLALTALYILASLLLLRVMWVTRNWAPRERLLWGTSTVVLLILTVNKQLDLQHFLNNTARCLMTGQDMSAHLGGAKRAVGAALLLIGLGGTAWFLRRTRSALAANRPLVLAILLMAAFVAVEVARFEALLGDFGETIEQLRLHLSLIHI